MNCIDSLKNEVWQLVMLHFFSDTKGGYEAHVQPR